MDQSMNRTATTTATRLLWEDHRRVEDLYEEFNQPVNENRSRELGEEICRELEIHERIEESLVYPRLAKDFFAGSLSTRMGREHGDVRRMISEYRLSEDDRNGMRVMNSGIISRMMVSVKQHIAEEEAEVFSLLEANGPYNGKLGMELEAKKASLQSSPPLHKTIDLKVPVRVAYNQWTQFEEFPHFMDSVKHVTQIDDTHLQWNVSVMGKQFQWTAEIYEQIPDRRIAWSSLDGAVHTGAVTFRPLGLESCRMLVELAYEPSGMLEDFGAMLGMMSRQVQNSLENFKDYIEGRSQESGAWRGQVEGTPVDPEMTRSSQNDLNEGR